MPTRTKLSRGTRARILLVVLLFMGVFAAYIDFINKDIGADTFQLTGTAMQRHLGFFIAHIIVLTALVMGVWNRQHWTKVGLLGYFFVTALVSGTAIPCMWYTTSNFPFGFFVACVTRFAGWLLVVHSANLKRLANPAYISVFTT